MPYKTYETAYDHAEEPPPPNTARRGDRGSEPTPVIPQKTALLLSGSRDWEPDAGREMAKYVFSVVQHAKKQDLRLIVGDNPRGVDAATIKAATRYGVDTTVYGSGKEPRNRTVADSEACRYVQVMREEVDGDKRSARLATHTERDQQMVDGADRVLTVWNGKSKGTRAVYEYARDSDKDVHLAMVRDGRMQIVRSHSPDVVQADTPEVEPDAAPAPAEPVPPQAAPTVAPDDGPQAVYTLGYAGVDIEDVQATAQALDATLVDIRLSGRSRKPGFNKGALREAFGEDYLHLPQLGNKNYNQRDKGIELRDYDAGLQALREQAPAKPLLLMCGCKDVHTCHRKAVAERLAADGYDYRGEALEVVAERLHDQQPSVAAPEQSPHNVSEEPTRADVPDVDLVAEPDIPDLAQMDLDAQFELSCALTDIPPERLRAELAGGLNFSALPLEQVGVRPTEPTLEAPPYYDEERDTALWVGVVQDGGQFGTTCLLAVDGARGADAQAYLTPCYRGELDDALDNGQQLIDALQETGDVNRLLGVAEGMARANGMHHLWARPDGLPLEDSVSDALAKHVDNEHNDNTDIEI